MQQNQFLRNVATLLSGTSVALAIPLLCSPILARLFPPAAIGQLALYLSAASIGAIVATGRYELAIVMPRNNRHSYYILLLSVLMSAAFSISVLILIIVVWLIEPAWMNGADYSTSVYLVVPVGIFTISAVQALIYWEARQQRYNKIAIVRAKQALWVTAIQLAFGAVSSNPFGLIGGQLLGGIFTVSSLAKGCVDKKLSKRPKLLIPVLCAVASRYKTFPKFMVAGHLANAISSQLPIIMLASLYGPKEAGIYAFAERVTLIPFGVVTNSVGEVYRQDAAREYQVSGNCLSLYVQTTKRLMLLAIVPALVLFTLAPHIFTFAFGEIWSEAGSVAAALGVLLFFQSVSSPLSQTVLFASMYRADLVWQFLRLTASFVALYLGFLLTDDYLTSIILYAVVTAVAYVAHSVMQILAARGRVQA